MSHPLDRYGPGLILLAALCLPPCSEGRTVTLMPAGDATLHEASELGSVANGSGEYLFAGRLGPNGAERVRRALLRFETGGSVPAGAQVTNAVLRLVMTRTASDAASVEVHALNRDWGEGPSQAANGQGEPAQPGDATWYHAFFDTDRWAVPGGDFAAAPSAVATVVSNGIYTWSGPALERDVQAWVDYPDRNHGWILLGNEDSPGTVKRFASRESVTPALRPQLEVSFRDPAPVENVLFSSVLTPEQVLPAAGVSPAGIALVAFDRELNTLGIRLHHNAAAADRVRLYGPASPGETGPLVLELGPSDGLVITTNRLSDAHAQDLLNGGCYLRVEQNGTGILRGQIGVEDEFSAVLSGPPAGSGAPFDGVAVFRIDHAAQQLHVTALHNVPDAAVLQLRSWDGIRAGSEVLASLLMTNGLLYANVPLPPREFRALVCGARSLGVVSAGQSEPAIAGPVTGIDLLPHYGYAALMNGAQAVPSAENSFSGVAIAGYDPAARRAHYQVIHDVDSPMAAFLLGGAGPGTNGTVVLNLGTPRPAMRGTTVLSVSEARDLQNGLQSVSVHNSAFPGGAIKGQLEAADQFVCVMRGRDARPPVATSHGGAAILRLDSDAQLLSYTVMHTAGTNAVLSLQSRGQGCGCCERHLPAGGGFLLTGAVSVCASFIDGLLQGGAWLSLAENAETPEYLRGWIQPAQSVTSPTHVIAFSGQPGGITNETGSVGVAVVSLDCAAQILHSAVYHTAGTQAVVRLDPGSGGEPLPDIILDESAAEGVVYACLSLASNVVNEVQAGALSAELETVFGPGQNVPGRFVEGYDFAVSLSGRGQGPVRATTSAGAIGLFRYHEDPPRLDGIVLHPYGTNAVVSLIGPQGETAGTLAPVQNGAHGQISLTDHQAACLVRRQMRIDISRGGRGLIRGTLERIQSDRDCDGIPDYWETAYGGQVDAYDRDSDLDLDGHSALEEFYAGTLPQEGSSVLGVTAATNASGLDIIFPSVTGRRYVLEYADEVRGAVWQEVSPARFGTGEPVRLSHTNTASAGGVYRVRVRLP